MIDTKEMGKFRVGDYRRHLQRLIAGQPESALLQNSTKETKSASKSSTVSKATRRKVLEQG